jgi:predicted amidohydrolase
MIQKNRFIIVFASILLLTCWNPAIAQHPSLRVAMVQMNVADGDLTVNMNRTRKSIKKVARMNVDMICLPEAADFGWLCQQAREVALPVPGKYTDFLSNLAQKYNVWISAGCLEKDGDNTYNSAILINRSGDIVLKHRKINTLPELTSHLYEPGSDNSIKVVDTEFGLVGLTICADNFDINNPQKVADRGAWLLISPHGFAAEESDLDNAVKYMNHIKNVAKKTKLWVIGTDSALSPVAGGEWKGQVHSGCSTIANPSGKAVALGKIREPDLVIYTIPSEK